MPTLSDNVATNTAKKSTPLDNVATSAIPTLTCDASSTEELLTRAIKAHHVIVPPSASGSPSITSIASPSVDSYASQIFASGSSGRQGGSAFLPTPPKLLRGEPFLKSMQVEKSNCETPDDEISDEIICNYLGVNNAAAVAKEKDIITEQPCFKAEDNEYDSAFAPCAQ